MTATRPRSRQRDFDTTEQRMVATKNDFTLAAIVRGIRDPDRARRYIEAELELADDADREPRRDLIAMCNAKVSELTEDADESEDGG